ncbi:MAG: single-stranded-DNA-specific exonuclease RecJ [Lachnospiraceae bacterium]|nr:single-stranded-DNA-specific exonuclease RecJ [Lachnospiraceae bacterium]
MAKWFQAYKKADFEALAKQFSLDPVLIRIMRNRDLIEEQDMEKYLYGTMQDTYSGKLLKGMEEAVSILEEKILSQKYIRIIGDYDVDGICATTILKKGLLACGANVDTVIPHRQKDGYGINEHLIQEAAEDGVDTIVTCDNGIAAFDQIAYGKAKGLTFLITDHHEVPFELVNGEKQYRIPQADVVIDPKLPDCPYPYKQICGAFVAYKLVACLWEKMGIQKDHSELIELAGLATVCDVMELLDENRILVKTALKSMQEAKNVGLRALIKLNEIDKISGYHLGFIIGPCLNAAGRLDTAGRALELLTCEDYREAIFMASELKALNESRKTMTEHAVEQAIQWVEENCTETETVLVVYLPECHESLAGIIAGRVKERYHKPTFVLTNGEDCVKGSGRSIEAYSMYEEMTKCKELFVKYGGHRQAAGLSLAEENVDRFRQRMNELSTLTPDDMEEKITIDVPMPLSYVTKNLVNELEILQPFGNGNPKPIFAQKDLTFFYGELLGKNKSTTKLLAKDEQGNRFEIMLFHQLDQFREDLIHWYGENALEQLFSRNETDTLIKLHILYYPSINEFRGRSNLQFIMQQWKKA